MNNSLCHLLFFYFLFISILSCSKPPLEKGFDLNGKSALTIINTSNQPLEIALENWYLLPTQEQTLDTTILQGDTLMVEVITQANNYYDLRLNEGSVKIFAVPEASITINYYPEEITFSGDHQSINQFLAQKATTFQSVNADWMPRTNYTHGNYTLTKLVAANDSMTTWKRINQRFPIGTKPLKIKDYTIWMPSGN